MEFVNETGFSAILLTTVIDAERMAASLVVRVTYGIGPPRDLTVAGEQPWITSMVPWDSPRGKMENDLPFMKDGVDLFVWGSARAPRGVPVSRLEVGVELLPSAPSDARPVFRRRATVSGPRVWRRADGGGLVPTSPASFTELPLTPANAFGGKGSWDGLEVPWGDNPDGMGYALFEADAEGLPLPHIEETDALIEAWDAKPPVAGFGFCAISNGARLRNGVVLHDDNIVPELRSAIFNTAYPQMIAPEARPGDVLRVTGVRVEGPLELELPEVPVVAHLMFGEKRVERVPSIDQIGVEVDEARVFITYRYPFRFVMRERELRRATLVPRKA